MRHRSAFASAVLLWSFASMPGWAAPADWRAGGKVVLSEDGNSITAACPGDSSDLELYKVTPQPLAGLNGNVGGWMFFKTSGEKAVPVNVQFVLRDARGVEYRFNASNPVFSGGWEYVRSFPVEARKGDLIPPFCAATSANPPLRPSIPLSLTGLRISAKGARLSEVKVLGVRLLDLDFKKSSCYWLIADRTFYGAPSIGTVPMRYRCVAAEESGVATPFLLPSDLTTRDGSYHAAWRIRNTSTGNMVANGTFSFENVRGGSGGFNPVALPLLASGNYKLDLRLTDAASKSVNFEAWLLVFNSSKAAEKEGSATVPNKDWKLAIAPDNPSGIFDSGKIPLSVSVFSGDGRPLDLEVKLSRFDQTPCKTFEESIKPSPGNSVSTVHFEVEMPSGESVLNVECSLVDVDKNILEQDSRMIGVKGIAPARFPSEKPEARIAATDAGNVEPFYIGITAMGPKFRNDEVYKSNLKMLHDAGLRGIEFSVEWNCVEPLPGCWTFSELDKLLQYAASQGFKISLRMRNEFPRYTVPDWISGDLMRQQDGQVDGVVAGAPVFSPLDRQWVDAYLKFQRTVISRYAGLAAVDSVKLSQNIREAYWVDRPFKYEFTDYSDAAASAFRDYLKDKYGDISKVSAAHGRNYPGWSDIDLPQPYEDAGDIVTSVRWIDFMDFKDRTYNRHLLEVASNIHDAAPRIRAFVYSINWLTGPPTGNTLKSFIDLNGAGALGASHFTGEVYYARLYCPAYGLQIRLEPNSYAIISANMIDEHAGEMLEGAGGGRPTFFCYWPNKPGTWFPKELAPSILGRIAAWDSAILSMPSISMPQADLGIAFSWESMSLIQRGNEANYYAEGDVGLEQILQGRGIQPFGADDYFSSDMLSKFKLLVVPAGTSFIVPVSMRDRLVSYVQGGGCLVMEPDTARRPDGSEGSLAACFGFSGDVDTQLVSKKFGKGEVISVPGEAALKKYLASDDFLALYTSLGGLRRAIPLTAGLVATIHQGGDGRMFLYLFNGSRDALIKFRLEDLEGKTVKLRDILNKDFERDISPESGASEVQMPLPPQRAALLELKEGTLADSP